MEKFILILRILSQELVVDSDVLELYVGNYQLSPDLVITISKDGKQLKGKATGQEEYQFIAKEENIFIGKTVNLQLTFNSSVDGVVESLTLLAGGSESVAPKIEEYWLKIE